MKKLIRIALITSVVFGLGSIADSTPAFAYFHHHHKHHARKTHHKHKGSNSAMVRDAQMSLIRLGYLTGHADGVIGPKTRHAIMTFQREHGLRATGQLTRATYSAIIKADHSLAAVTLPEPMLVPVTPHDTLAAQPGLVGPTDTQYADPLRGGKTVFADPTGNQSVRTQEVSSRFAKLDINENTNGPMRRYNITLNGTPILLIDHQPSIIGVSETYAFDHEDAIILTTFHDGDPVCAYKYYLLTLTEGKNELRVIGNCTHGYQSRKVEDSLFITFPETDDQRVAGATWRYENGDLERL